MYGEEKAAEELDRTAFRRAGKKYKLYYDNSFKSSKKYFFRELASRQLWPCGWQNLWHLSDTTMAIMDTFNQNGEVPPGIMAHTASSFDRHVFSLKSRPAREGKVIVEDGSMTDTFEGKGNACGWKFVEEEMVEERGNGCKSVSASILLRKLRWSTLGLQFDWSQRNYNVSLPHDKILDALCQLERKMAAPALPPGQEFKPEAAIVNYFALGDTLGGHLDDMEKDWSRPIVSMSLDCKTIFLLGGKSRQETPTAMFLQSGDIVLTAGEALECFHGVPRIFTDQENAEISPRELQLSNEEMVVSPTTSEVSESTLTSDKFSD